MDFLMIGFVAFLASGLTLYSGFGLGTVLLPAFALFFAVPTAVAATGAVHLLNNLFKGSLVGRDADWTTVRWFGIPAMLGAILGALLLGALDKADAGLSWSAFGRDFSPSGAGLAIGLLMVVFALLELQPWFQRLAAPPRLMPLGGLLTGFLGGLSGQQGALRSMFLLKSGLDARHYVATGTQIAILIDLSRLPTYGAAFVDASAASPRDLALVAAATVCAWAGAWLGVRYLRKATIGTIRMAVAGLMLLVGGLLMSGVLGS